MSNSNVKKIPPDGGYGWFIILAYGLNGLIAIPILTSFGMIYNGKFTEMGFSATDKSIVINTNSSISMMTGLFNGTLLKIFGYRKVSYVSAVLTFIGLVSTAFANSFTWLLVSYGLITSVGLGIGFSSYSLAVNSYFSKKRSKAISTGMTISAVGLIIMPQVFTYLLYLFDVKYTMLLIAGIALHAFIAASLLQPVERHKIEVVLSEDDSENEDDMKEITGSQVSLDVYPVYGIDTPLGSVLSLTQEKRQRKYSLASYTSNKTTGRTSTLIEAKTRPLHYKRTLSEHKDTKYTTLKMSDINEERKDVIIEGVVTPTTIKETHAGSISTSKNMFKKEPNRFRKACKYLAQLMDLDLLKDPVYVNIMMGISLATFTEISFAVMTPFFLIDFNFNTQQVATFLSVLSITDIVFRFVAPYMADYLKLSSRIMYMISLVLLIISRSFMLFSSQYITLLAIAASLGVGKGLRVVFMTLVIPDYVPIDKLANASGMQMVMNGLLVLIGGPTLGLIRDITGSYMNGLYVINAVSLVTLTIWSIEICYKRYQPKTENVSAR